LDFPRLDYGRRPLKYFYPEWKWTKTPRQLVRQKSSRRSVSNAPPSGGDAGRLPSRDRLTRHPQQGQHRAGTQRDGTRDRVPPARDIRYWITASDRDTALLGPGEPWRHSLHTHIRTSLGSLSPWERYLFPSPCLRIVDSDPKHGKSPLQLLSTCLCSVSGRKLGFQPAIHFERVA
jgi:hypothetical protein